MSAHQGDSSPEVFVFPPFAPPAPRTEAPAAPIEEPQPAAETVAEPESLGFDVPLPAHDVGDRDADEAAIAAAPSWEGAADESPAAAPSWDIPDETLSAEPAWGESAGETSGTETSWAAPASETPAVQGAPAEEHDLPWLEMPDGGPTIHATEGMAAPAADVPAPAADEEPSWMAWESEASATGDAAAEITPPPLATAGELTSVSAVPSAALDAPAESGPAAMDEDGAAPDPYAPAAEAVHPETMPSDEPAEEVHSWPVEAMEPASLQAADDAPVVEAPAATAEIPVHSPAIDHSAFGHIAGRLEEFARSLRNDPGSFVATHHDDPLALLIAGFAMGYRQGTKAGE